MISLRLTGVSLEYPVYDSHSRSLRRLLISAGSRGRIGTGNANIGRVRVLDGIDLDVRHGDRLALIGRNGAGKTTLLRVMAGIFEPDQGTVCVDGRVAALFSTYLGFNQECTGRENIMLRGLYLGLTRAAVRERIGEIAEFSGLGLVLDQPIRTYSDGMRSRLAFTISTSLKPEILLIDEGIETGDRTFLEKASKRLHAFIGRAGILVLASHSEKLIRQMCNKAVLLDGGKIVSAGSVDAILNEHGQG